MPAEGRAHRGLERSGGPSEQKVVQPVAMRLLRGEFEDGDTIVMNVRHGDLAFSKGESRVPEMPGPDLSAIAGRTIVVLHGGICHGTENQGVTRQRIFGDAFGRRIVADTIGPPFA